MKILVTGSNGLLGQKLVKALQVDDEVQLIATSLGEDRISGVSGYTYLEMDITDRDQVMRVIQEFKPDTIIHTAAMTNVDACELDPEQCELLNVTAVQYMIEASERVGAHLIHLSTDFVFDGKEGPYKEDDTPRPLSIYGDSKYRSELLVQESKLERWTIVRTVIVYGIVDDMSRSNVVLWAKGALEKGEPIKVVNDQWRMPTLAEDLADGCIRIAKQQAVGIYHICGPELMSILELVERVGEHYGLSTESMSPIESASLGQPAKRPPRTEFILDKARKELGYSPSSLKEGLLELDRQLALR